MANRERKDWKNREKEKWEKTFALEEKMFVPVYHDQVSFCLTSLMRRRKVDTSKWHTMLCHPVADAVAIDWHSTSTSTSTHGTQSAKSTSARENVFVKKRKTFENEFGHS